jgi:hypothetical protein
MIAMHVHRLRRRRIGKKNKDKIYYRQNEKNRAGKICPCCGEEYEEGLWEKGKNFCSRGAVPCYQRCKYKGGASGRPCQNQAKPTSSGHFNPYCKAHQSLYSGLTKEEKKKNFFQAKKS